MTTDQSIQVFFQWLFIYLGIMYFAFGIADYIERYLERFIWPDNTTPTTESNKTFQG